MAPASENRAFLRWALYTSSLGNYFFREIRDLIGAGLGELGHTVEFRDEKAGFASQADCHLVVAPHEFFHLGQGEALAKRTVRGNLVLFNTEQPSTQWFQLAAKHFPRAAALWDIDFESALRISKEGHPCSYLPLGYATDFEMFREVTQLPVHDETSLLAPAIREGSFLARPFAERPIDVLFLGHASARREQFFAWHGARLAAFKNYLYRPSVSRPLITGQTTNMNTLTSVGLGQRSKILLNVHHGVDKYFEWHRIVLLGIAQRALVISEPCSLAPPFRANVDFVEAPLDELPERLEFHLSSADGQRQAQEIIGRGFETLTHRCRIREMLRPLVDELRCGSRLDCTSIAHIVAPAQPPARLEAQVSVCVVTPDVAGEGEHADCAAAQVLLAETLAATGQRVALLHTNPPDSNHSLGFWAVHFAERNIHYVPLPHDLRVPLETSVACGCSYETFLWLRQRSFDVVHLPETDGVGLYSLLARNQGLAFERTRFCLNAHTPRAWRRQASEKFVNNPYDLEREFMERECFRLADALVTSTDFMLGWLEGQNWGLPGERSVRPDLPRLAQRLIDGERGHVRTLAYAGPVHRSSDLELFCQGIERLGTADLGAAEVVFLMPRPSQADQRGDDYVQRRVRQWTTPWKVVEYGDSEDLYAFLAKPGCLVVLSTPQENSPLLLRRCLERGVRFLSSCGGGVPELVAAGNHSQVLFAPKPAALATLLLDCIRQGAVRPQPAAGRNERMAVWLDWYAEWGRPVAPVAEFANSTPLVSVCLVHFNRPEFLKQALASLRAQDYSNFEVVLVDDGSTKRQAIELLAQLEAEFKQRNWKLIRQENRYLGAARNAAARSARGEYLIFMDDDNVAKPHEISTFVRVAQKTGADMLTCAMDLFTGDRSPDPASTPKARWVFLGGAAATGVIRNCFGDANGCIRREAFWRVGGFTEDYGITHEDWEFYARAVLQGCRLETIPEALFWYRVAAGSMIQSTSIHANLQRNLRPYLAAVPEPLGGLVHFIQGTVCSPNPWAVSIPDYHDLLGLHQSLLAAGRELDQRGSKAEAQAICLKVLQSAETLGHSQLQLRTLMSVAVTLAHIGGQGLAKALLDRAAKLTVLSQDQVASAEVQFLQQALAAGGRLDDVAARIKLFEAGAYRGAAPKVDTSARVSHFDGLRGASISETPAQLSSERVPVCAATPDSVALGSVWALSTVGPSVANAAPSATLKRTVGFLAFEPHDYACPSLRLKSVLEHLSNSDAAEVVPLGAVRDGQFQIQEKHLKHADIVVVQRQMAAALPFADLRKRLAGHPAKIVFEIDDALTLLPEWHRASAAFRRIKPEIEEYLRQADLVTVSTPQLQALYAPLNRNILVLPNSVDTGLWSTPSDSPEPSEKVTILFSGTLDHERDLQVVESAMLDLIAAFPDQVEFQYWGNITERLRGLRQVKSVGAFLPNYQEYAAQLQKLPVSFAVVPLEDIAFNRAKSAIKWLEYSICRIPGIYSDLPAYNQTVVHGKTGLLVPNSRDAWFNAMKALVENRALRHELAARAQAAVLASHTVEHNAHLWLQAYESLFTSSTPRPARVEVLEVSIVIPTFNKVELTRQCLSKLRQHTPGELHEVIVVDNGSTDGTVEFLKAEEAAGRLRVVSNRENLGFAKACNLGAKAARGKWILFLNNDTEVQAGWLDPLLALAAEDPRIAAVGSKLLFPDGTLQHAGVALGEVTGRDPFLAVHTFYKAAADLPEANQRRVYQALTAACLLVRKSAFEEVSGFDEGFWNGYEDVDLCLQFQERGWLCVYEPASVVIHHESQSGPARFQKVQENIRRLHQKWLGKAKLDVIVAPDGAVTPAATTRIRPYVPGTSGAAPTSIVILSHNQLAHTKACLESIARHTPEPHELVLVDNGSSDGTPEHLREYALQHGRVIVVTNRTNRGFAAGNNQGLALATGRQVLFLNNDTVVTPGWLGNMLTILRDHPQTGVVGPRSNRVLGKQQVDEVGYNSLEELPAFAVAWAEQYAGQSRVANRVVGFCLLARKSVVDRIGGLDEQFGSGNFEDDDFCIRAHLAGFETRIADDSFVHHVGNATFTGAGIDYSKAMQTNWGLFKRKWAIPPETPPFPGYLTPDVAPLGVVLKVPLPDLKVTHEFSAQDRCWVDKSLAAEQAKPKPIVLPPCALVGRLTEAREFLRQKKLPAAWGAARAALKHRPFHPEAYLLLGEIAQAAQEPGAARNCGEFARQIAPEFRAAKKFLKGKFYGHAKHDWLLLPEEIGKPKSDRRRHLSVCLIVKNEEKFLGQCLSSVKGLADQIVVVDTGSTDRTVAIAREHGAQVHTFVWCDDFSAARNAALEHATGDWILMLDADEELPSENYAALRKLLRTDSVMAWRLPIIDVGREDEGCCYVPRLFRNAPGLFYAGRVHEQVFGSLEARRQEWGLENRLGDAALRHHGYRPDVVKDRNKIERNLRLLEQAVAESPDDPNLLMNHGLELTRSGRLDVGVEQYQRAFAILSRRPADSVVPELREMLLTQMSTHLMAQKRFDELVRMLASPLAKAGGLTASLHFNLGLAQFELKQFSEAAGQMRQCLAKRNQPALAPINQEIRKAGPHHCLALCLDQMGETDAAAEEFRLAIEADPPSRSVRCDHARFLAAHDRQADALNLLFALANEQPADAQVWLQGGQLALARPEFLEVALDWTTEAARNLPEHSAVIQQQAEALMLAGRCDEALPLWRRCPSSSNLAVAAALVICETVAGQNQFSPASENEAAVSREFVKWYQKLLQFSARPMVEALNASVETLEKVLPTAASILASALAEANETTAAEDVPV